MHLLKKKVEARQFILKLVHIFDCRPDISAIGECEVVTEALHLKHLISLIWVQFWIILKTTPTDSTELINMQAHHDVSQIRLRYMCKLIRSILTTSQIGL